MNKKPKNMKEKPVISASRRTDIPAFYSEWFINRVRAGYCTVVIPSKAGQVSYVSLKPDDVSGFVFWTRNPQPFLKHLPELDKNKYKYYFHYTIVGYPKDIEPNCPSVEAAVKIFKVLSKSIGKEKVVWRYDPVFLTNKTSLKWHLGQVSYLMKALSGYTNRLVISFIDSRRKNKILMENAGKGGFELLPDSLDLQSYNKISEFIGKEAGKYGFEVQSCSEVLDFDKYGITHGRCIDDKLLGNHIKPPFVPEDISLKKDACDCVISQDIGINNTDLFGSKYSYGAGSLESANANFRRHDKNSPSLIDWHEADVPENR